MVLGTTLDITYNKQLSSLWEKAFKEAEKIVKPKNSILLESNQKIKHLYFLQKGEVSFRHTHLDGRETLLAKISAPDLIATSSFFTESKSFPPSVHLDSDCIIYAFTEEWVYKKLLPDYPDLALTIIKTLATKLDTLTEQKILLSSDSIHTVICKIMQNNLFQEKNITYSRTNLTQQELANFLGIHRISISRALNKLQQDGIIGTYKKNKTEILDLEKFNKISEQYSFNTF